MPSDAVIRSRAKKMAIEYRTGKACRYRYAGLYWMRIGTEEEGNQRCDTSPGRMAGELKRNGEENYPHMIEVCDDE